MVAAAPGFAGTVIAVHAGIGATGATAIVTFTGQIAGVAITDGEVLNATPQLVQSNTPTALNTFNALQPLSVSIDGNGTASAQGTFTFDVLPN